MDRINDVHKIVDIIERFEEKTGHYPYEETFNSVEEGFVAVPVSVIITDKALPEQYQYPPPGRSGVVISANDFLAYLREALGPEIVLPYDDAPLPRFYQYLIDGESYFVSAVLFAPTDNTRELRPGWHKYEVRTATQP